MSQRSIQLTPQCPVCGGGQRVLFALVEHGLPGRFSEGPCPGCILHKAGAL